MIKLFFISLFILFGNFNFLYASYLDKDTAARLNRNTDAIIAKDLKTNQLIFSKDSKEKNQPASLTKIMTAILAIESGRMNQIVTITRDMIHVEPTKAGLRVGEKFYLRDLVKAAMVKSANDAAMAIGIFLGNGDMHKFVAMMNRKAKLLGMNSTHFTNPCGFDIGNHYSTAHDLLIMSEYVIKNHRFNEMAKLKRHHFKSLNTKKSYTVYTHNKLLNNYQYAVGIKTGFTQKAGPCLIARAKKGNKDILVVMLNSAERWNDIRVIFDDVLPTLTQSTKKNHKTPLIKSTKVKPKKSIQKSKKNSVKSKQKRATTKL